MLGLTVSVHGPLEDLLLWPDMRLGVIVGTVWWGRQEAKRRGKCKRLLQNTAQYLLPVRPHLLNISTPPKRVSPSGNQGQDT